MKTIESKNIKYLTDEESARQHFKKGPQGLIREYFLKDKEHLLKDKCFTRFDVEKFMNYHDLYQEIKESIRLDVLWHGKTAWFKPDYKIINKVKHIYLTDDAIKWIQMN